MTRYRYSPAPSGHGPEEIDVTTIPVPDEWRSGPLADGNAPGLVALTSSALDRLVDALARRQLANLPEELSPYGMVALLDAAWDQDFQPWRDLVMERLRDHQRLRGHGRTHRDFQQHLYELQGAWGRAWMSRHGDYMAWLTDGAVTDETVQQWEDWAVEEIARQERIQANPGRLSVEQIAQLTRAAILQVAREPVSWWAEDVVEGVLPLVEAEAAAVPPRPEAGDPDVTPAGVVDDMVGEYLRVRLESDWPAGRASAWAVGQVIDWYHTLASAEFAHQQGDSELATEAEQELASRARASRAAWEDPSIQPWLRGDVGWLQAARSPETTSHELTAQARTATTSELHAWVDQAQVLEERPLGLELAVAQDAVHRTSSHHDAELVALRGLRQQLEWTGPSWRPGTWRQRAILRARITEQERAVHALDELLGRAEKRLGELLPARTSALRDWQARQDLTIGRAVVAAKELRLREQGLLEELTVGPPADLEQTLGTPPLDAAGSRTWQAQALQLERARAAGGLQVAGEVARAAASILPPSFSGSAADQQAAAAWITARDQAGWPVSPATRAYAMKGELPGNHLSASRTAWLDGMHLTYPTGSPPLAHRLGHGPPSQDLCDPSPQP
jgi:hypothetical protein